MALKVWLPLNRDLRSVGLSKVTVINSGATLDNNGIIGKCYNISLGKYIGLDAKNVNNHKYSPISIALWFYPTQNDSTERYVLGCWESGGSGIYLKNQKIGFHIYVGGYKTCEMPTTITLNTWHHICGTYDEKIMRLYIDGVEVATTSVSGKITYHSTCPWEIGGNPGATAFGYGNIAGKFNDIRMYDHCITEEDVKRLYQCKVFGIDSHGWSTDTFVADTFDGYRQAKPVNIVATPSSLKFNGNSYIDTEGISMTGGTLSVWFTMSAIPTTTSNIIYCDQKSKMAIGFYSKNLLIVTCNGLDGNAYIHSNKLLANKWNNVTIVYNKSDGKPSICYINGSAATNSKTNCWTSTGKILSIGRRYGGTSPNYFNGSIGKIDIYSKSFTENEILEKYESEKKLFLPDDYIQLEYIQSDGKEWIDTLYVPNANSCVYLKFKEEAIVDKEIYYPITCVRGNDNKLYLECFVKGEKEWAYSVNGSEFTDTLSSVLSMTEVEMSLAQFKVNGKVIRTADKIITVSNTDRKLFIFAYNKGGTPDSSRYMSCNLYEFKCWENINNNKVFKLYLIPAKRKSDNVIGMYDMVTKRFFTNSGTGSFTEGHNRV